MSTFNIGDKVVRKNWHQVDKDAARNHGVVQDDGDGMDIYVYWPYNNDYTWSSARSLEHAPGATDIRVGDIVELQRYIKEKRSVPDGYGVVETLEGNLAEVRWMGNGEPYKETNTHKIRELVLMERDGVRYHQGGGSSPSQTCHHPITKMVPIGISGSALEARVCTSCKQEV